MIREMAPRADIARTPLEKTDLGSLSAVVRRAESVVFLCFEARRFAGQAATLKLLAKSAAKKTVAVLIRSSWDLAQCPKEMTVVDAAGYRIVSLEASLSAVLENRP